MKEKILKILKKRFGHLEIDYCDDPSGNAAFEIASDFNKFMEWAILEEEIFWGELSEIYLLKSDMKFKTIDELFIYWLVYIKDR